MKFVLIGMSCLLIIGCSHVEEPITSSNNQDMVPDQEIWNGTIEITTNGHLQSIVYAGHIESFEKKNITHFSDSVQVDFYDKFGRHTSVLTSKKARVEEKTDLFVAYGNVVVVSDSGTVLRTERLYWNRSKGEVHSDTLVIMTTDVDSLRGYDFRANEDLSFWTLKNPTGRTFRKRQ